MCGIISRFAWAVNGGNGGFFFLLRCTYGLLLLLFRLVLSVLCCIKCRCSFQVLKCLGPLIAELWQQSWLRNLITRHKNIRCRDIVVVWLHNTWPATSTGALEVAVLRQSLAGRVGRFIHCRRKYGPYPPLRQRWTIFVDEIKTGQPHNGPTSTFCVCSALRCELLHAIWSTWLTQKHRLDRMMTCAVLE